MCEKLGKRDVVGVSPSSHRPMVANNFVTVLAAVLLIVAGGDAERNEAASEPAAEKGEYNAEDPGKGTL